MEKRILNSEQVRHLVAENRYKVDLKMALATRCIDGRYHTGEGLAPVGIPGADAGDLALIFATENSFGLEVDQDKVFKVLTELVGGEKKLQFHTDSHADPKLVLGGCGHIKQMTLDPEAYKVTQDQVEFIRSKFTGAKEQGAHEEVLHGEHMERAVLMVIGPYSVYPRYKLEADEGGAEVEVFVYHRSLSHERYRILAKKLIENGAVKLYNGLDDDYLYQALSDTAESHLMETAKRLAKGLPIYQIDFKDNGGFEVKELGAV